MVNSSYQELFLGILGSGGFSRFSVESFLKVPGIWLSGVFDKAPENANTFAGKFPCRIFSNEQELLRDNKTDIIYVATPPYLHYRNSKAALLAGKHVICEKPAALKAEEAAELVEIAQKKNLLYVVNLMQRYNPLFGKVKAVVDRKLLGGFLHGYFENYASDENLPPEHWMWDETKSGGFFIEHAVHFFDLFNGWLGKGEVIASQKVRKTGQQKDYWSEVYAACKYGDGMVNFYHGFTQPVKMDRQEFKLVFELGDITLTEWVPTTLRLYGLVTHENLEEIKKIFPGEEVKIIREFNPPEKKFVSNFKNRKADFEIILQTGKDAAKYDIYSQILTSMFADQIAWIRNHDHHRVITGFNGLNSLIIAGSANQKAVLL